MTQKIIRITIYFFSIGYESNTEYLTFNINEALDPDNNLLVESVENLDISGYSMPKTSTNVSKIFIV